MIALKVTNAFAGYGIGDTITSKSGMNDALATNPGSVVRLKLSDEEADAVKAAADAAKPATKPAPPEASKADAGKTDTKPA